MSGGIDVRKIRLAYVCGNTFKVSNFNAAQVLVAYSIRKTGEEGSVTLPAAPGGDPNYSETRFTTRTVGTVDLQYNGKKIETKGNGGTVCVAPPPPPPPPSNSPAVIGAWSSTIAWPDVAIHLHVLPSGKVLTWGRTTVPPQVWDPNTRAFSPAPSPSLLFCSGHDYLPNGRLLAAGGHITDGHGLPNGNIFDASSQSWAATAAMAFGRWYPSATSLGSGDVVVLAGTDQNGNNVETPEVWSNGSWRQLTGAVKPLPYYPRVFLAPNGRLFYAGENQDTWYLDPSGAGQWTFVANRVVASRDYGSAVMYEPGKILYVGGGAPTATAEIIDLNQGAPSWRATNSMHAARRQLNATILANGMVLVTGGSSGPGFSDESGAVLTAELWDPASERWTTVAAEAVVRVYHSTAVLLPDARVLEAGSGGGASNTDQRTGEIFTPPYLYNSSGVLAARPTITGVTGSTGYGGTLNVQVSSASPISKVTLVRLSSTTHAFNQGQRILFPSFSAVTGGVSVTLPGARAVAPAGPYMLFVLDGSGVPSVAKIINLQ